MCPPLLPSSSPFARLVCTEAGQPRRLGCGETRIAGLDQRPVHKKPSTRNPTQDPRTSIDFSVWEHQ
eukprot:5366639-Pyramimonas_sp.AAC.1